MSVIYRAALVFLPLALATLLVVYLLYSVQLASFRTSLQNSERGMVALGRQNATLELGSAVSDVLYLSESESLKRWLASGAVSALRDLAESFATFAKYREHFGQLRLIDATGQERIRVNRQGDRLVVVPDERLQDKSERYYVRETLRLERGQVYISRFDLNVEHGVVERPFNPVMRIATPIVDDADVSRGMVVLNYRGTHLLERIETRAAQASRHIWLLNADGYWLLGPSPEDEWAFMFPERTDRTFASSYPEAWAKIQQGEEASQFVQEGDLFTYAKVVPAAPTTTPRGNTAASPSVVAPEPWILVAWVPAETFAARRTELASSFTYASVGLALPLAAVALGIAYHWSRHREAEQRLRISESSFRAVAQSAGDGIISADSQGRITYFNDSAERLFGYTADEAVGQSLTILMPERLRRPHSQAFERFITTQEPMLLGKTIELIGLRKDGEEFPVELSLASWTVDQEIFITSILRDISERKRTEMELRRREIRFRGLLESAPDAVVITDKEGRIVLTNVQTELLFGYDRTELLGKQVETLIPERYREQHAGHRSSYVSSPQPRPMGLGLELFGVRRDGTEFPVAISLSPVETEEGLLVFADVRDVTEQRQAESRIRDLNQRLVSRNAELTALNKELDAFSHSVSHDLRAPLRAIDGFSHALLEDNAEQLDDEGRDFLSRIRRASQHMGWLIDDLLNLSRVSRRELTFEKVDLSAAANEVVSELQEATPERQATVTITPGLQASGDQGLLRIALRNLLSNAWKFTADRSPALIEFGQARLDGTPVYFIRDNGVGFDMHHAANLFGAFQRLHNSSRYPGTGIGLATVQRIINKHGGRIWAEAEPDRGATFYFTL